MFIDEDEPLTVPRHRDAMHASPPAILYVENNVLLAQLVRDLFDLSGWQVCRAENGVIAKMFLNNEERRYKLLLVDNELHDMSGIELVRHARTLPYYKSRPIMLFSIEDCEREAKAAGVN